MTWPKRPESHIANTYTNNYFFGGGAGYPNYFDEKQILIQHGHRYANILGNFIPKKGNVLDVGCAAGFILKGLIAGGWKGHGIEPNAKMAEYARSRLGLDVTNGVIESYRAKKKHDLVCLIQVIAHIIDPHKTLEVIRNLLTQESCVLVETWDSRSWTAKFFGKHWHEYSPPSVLHWFSRDSLDYLFNRNKFKRIATGRPFKKISLKHASSLIAYKIKDLPCASHAEKILKRIFHKSTIPYPAEDLFWALYKKIP